MKQERHAGFTEALVVNEGKTYNLHMRTQEAQGILAVGGAKNLNRPVEFVQMEGDSGIVGDLKEIRDIFVPYAWNNKLT